MQWLKWQDEDQDEDEAEAVENDERKPIWLSRIISSHIDYITFNSTRMNVRI